MKCKYKCFTYLQSLFVFLSMNFAHLIFIKFFAIFASKEENKTMKPIKRILQTIPSIYYVHYVPANKFGSSSAWHARVSVENPKESSLRTTLSCYRLVGESCMLTASTLVPQKFCRGHVW